MVIDGVGHDDELRSLSVLTFDQPPSLPSRGNRNHAAAVAVRFPSASPLPTPPAQPSRRPRHRSSRHSQPPTASAAPADDFSCRSCPCSDPTSLRRDPPLLRKIRTRTSKRVKCRR
ncbi:hypothetical protein AAHA92_15653 [Salvia divinorum]|uniref:Uncharacterized protein n=1 Tax=Salvia divinorum TaxID=28513 RepID=A0ABD1HG93_SALDI